MKKVRIVVCSLIFSAAIFPAAPWSAKPAFAQCNPSGSFFCTNTIFASGTQFNCNLTISATYNPTKAKLTFTVNAFFSGDPSECTVALSSAGGMIGPFSFTMGESGLTVGSKTFPVTTDGNNWTASGAIKNLTTFDCASAQLQGSLSGTACSGSPFGYISQDISASGSATNFQCC